MESKFPVFEEADSQIIRWIMRRFHCWFEGCALYTPNTYLFVGREQLGTYVIRSYRVRPKLNRMGYSLFAYDAVATPRALLTRTTEETGLVLIKSTCNSDIVRLMRMSGKDRGAHKGPSTEDVAEWIEKWSERHRITIDTASRFHLSGVINPPPDQTEYIESLVTLVPAVMTRSLQKAARTYTPGVFWLDLDPLKP